MFFLSSPEIDNNGVNKNSNNLITTNNNKPTILLEIEKPNY